MEKENEDEPIPVIIDLQPAEVPIGSASFVLRLLGRSFAPGASVLQDGRPRSALWQSETEFVLDVDPTLFAEEGSIAFQVQNSDTAISAEAVFLIGPAKEEEVPQEVPAAGEYFDPMAGPGPVDPAAEPGDEQFYEDAPEAGEAEEEPPPTKGKKK